MKLNIFLYVTLKQLNIKHEVINNHCQPHGALIPKLLGIFYVAKASKEEGGGVVARRCSGKTRPKWKSARVPGSMEYEKGHYG